MSQVRVTGATSTPGVVVKATPKVEQVSSIAVSARTLVGPPGPTGPQGPTGPAGATGPSGGLIPIRAVNEGDALPDPGAERLAYSSVTQTLMNYVSGRWRSVSPGISVGTVAPSNPVLNQIWVDTN